MLAHSPSFHPLPVPIIYLFVRKQDTPFLPDQAEHPESAQLFAVAECAILSLDNGDSQFGLEVHAH